MKIPTLVPAALIAISLAGAAPAAVPAAPAANTATSVLTVQQDAPLPQAQGTFAVADSDSEVAQPDPHAENAAQYDAAAAPVPEPQMFLMMLIGLVLLGLASSRREAYEKFTD